MATHNVRSELVEELLSTRDGNGAAASALLTLCPVYVWTASPAAIREDSDGDLELPRRKRHQRLRSSDDPQGDAIVIETAAVGDVETTGVQLWRASLLLAEYLYAHKDRVHETTLLELGCGVGLIALIAAQLRARVVFATDGDSEALAVCERNIERNAWARARVRVRHLHWNSHGDHTNVPERFQLTQEERRDRVDWIVASDVFYDDEVADAFLDALHELMQLHPTATVVIAAERRVVFSAHTLSEISLGFDAFMSRVCRHQSPEVPDYGSCVSSCSQCHQLRQTKSYFAATPIPITSIPQLFDYERISTLCIWQLHAIVSTVNTM